MKVVIKSSDFLDFVSAKLWSSGGLVLGRATRYECYLGLLYGDRW